MVGCQAPIYLLLVVGKLLKFHFNVCLHVMPDRNNKERLILQNSRAWVQVLESKAAVSFSGTGADLVILILYEAEC